MDDVSRRVQVGAEAEAAAARCRCCGRGLVDVWCQRVRSSRGWSFVAVPLRKHIILEKKVGVTAMIVEPEWGEFDNALITVTPTFCRLYACPVHGTLAEKKAEGGKLVN